ncbi:MAG: protein kinase domain-containing protein, partial [Bythopirellula sp.]
MQADAAPNSSIKPIYLAALRLDDPRARQEYLNEACGNDVESRRNVEQLLAARDRAATNPLDQAVQRYRPAQTPPEGTADGESIDIASHPMIGPYKLLEQLGEGGMGTVFMAQQTVPIKRKVALKLINPGMDSQQVIARFEAERQALALMDHPNIAHVLDAGTTDQLRPFFVMELVKGVQITEYCANEKLSTENRLRLFVDVCRGIQHAHQKGVIHRDLKPSNLLVTRHDGRPVVKVIDFGVAKAINQELTERTLFTQYAQLIGTPLYMSPEQAELKGLDVDTRSDVYSLGVLMYELLTGTTPFDSETLRQAGFDEMRRIIREEEPPTPSSRLSTLASKQSGTTSEHYGTDPRRLTRAVRGELDWIVMKAMEKDRARRYDSASMLADDVDRYLEGKAVEACPASAVYRFRKLARRNRAALTTVALVTIAMALGTLTSLWQAREKGKVLSIAEDRATRLEEQRDLARDSESLARQLVYASDIQLAAQAWKEGDVHHYVELLDRHKLATSSGDLRGFEWKYLRQLGTVKFHTIAVVAEGLCSVRYSADGKFLAAGRYDGKIQVWDGRSDRQLALLSGHVDLVRGIAFSPDSKRLASIGWGGVIRIWDLEGFREIQSIEAFDN